MMKRPPLLILITFVYTFCNAQSVGIGINNPQAKLHIASGLSGYSGGYFPGAIVEGNTNTYLNLLTPNANESGLLFGNVSNAASGGIIYNNAGTPNGLQFRTNGNNTRMIVDNSGRIGMGVSPTISDGILDIKGRLRIQSGGDIFHTAGLWVNNINNSSLTAFIGMKDDDNHVGFYGSGIGWGFSMNTQTGALLINGTEGSPGQVLQSNGSGSVPTWATSTNTLYNNTVALEDAGSQTLTTADNFVNLTGMSYSFSVPGNAKLYVNFDVPVVTISCAFCGYSSLYVDIDIDGSFNARYHWDVANGTGEILTGSKIISLSAGSHTVTLQGSAVGNSNIFGGGGTFGIKRMNLQVIPQ